MKHRLTRTANNAMYLILCLIGFLAMAGPTAMCWFKGDWPKDPATGHLVFWMSLFLSLAPLYWGISYAVRLWRWKPPETIRGVRPRR